MKIHLLLHPYSSRFWNLQRYRNDQCRKQIGFILILWTAFAQYLRNASFEAINKHAKKTIDVHLMIVDPDRYIKTFARIRRNILSVHYEACTSTEHSSQ
jgi:hypothetical protein